MYVVLDRGKHWTFGFLIQQHLTAEQTHLEIREIQHLQCKLAMQHQIHPHDIAAINTIMLNAIFSKKHISFNIFHILICAAS